MYRISFLIFLFVLLLNTTSCLYKKNPETQVNVVTNETLYLEKLNSFRDTPVTKFNDSVSLLSKDTLYFPVLHSTAFGVKIEDPYQKQIYYFILLRDQKDPGHYCFIPCSFPNLENTCYPNMFYMHNVGFSDFNQYLNTLDVPEVPFGAVDSLFRMAHGYAHEIGVHLKEGEGIPKIGTIEEIGRYRFEMDSTRMLNTALLEKKLQDKNFCLYYYRGGLESIELISNRDYGMSVCDTIRQYQKQNSKVPKRYMVFHMKWN